jgi:PKD repeat protein
MRLHYGEIIVFVLALTGLLMLPAVSRAHATLTYAPGVKPGNMATYASASGSWSLPGPPQTPFSQFINLNYTTLSVNSVSGSNVTASQNFVYVNKTMTSDLIQGSLATNSSNLTFWFIAANLAAGDPIYTTPNAPVINQTITESFAGAMRTVNVLNSTQTPASGITVFTNVWWDQQTGIALLVDFRISEATGSAALFTRLAETNLWSSGPDFGMTTTPGSLVIQQGSNSSSSLLLSSERGFTGNVSIGYNIDCLSSCPRVFIIPTTVSLTPGGTASSSLIVTTTNGTAPGTYSVNLIGVSSSVIGNFTTLLVNIVAPSTTTVLSNDPNSTDWQVDSPVWSLKNNTLDGSGLTGSVSPKIISTATFSSDRTVQVDYRTVTPGYQDQCTAWILGKYVDFYDKIIFVLYTTGTLQMIVWNGTAPDTYTVYTSLTPTVWHHAQLVFSGNNAKAYINGTLYMNVTDRGIGQLGDSHISLASWCDSESQFTNIQVFGSVSTDEPPIASFFVATQPVLAGANVSFSAAASSDPDGSITNYSWSFGDGTTGTGEFPSHIYNNPGNYTVTLTVTDSAGLTATTSQVVIVGQRIVHDVGIVGLFPSPTVVISGQKVDVTAQLVNLGLQNETVSLTIYYGSHVAVSVQGINIPVTQFPYYVNALWNTTGVGPGNYTISARVFLATDQNPTNNFFIDGQVTILPPPVIVVSPLSGPVGTKVSVHGSGFSATGFPVSFPVTVDVTFDDQFIGFIPTTTDGAFNFVFNVPVAQTGPHQIHVIAEFYPSPVEATANFTVTSQPTTAGLSLLLSTGTVYFPGDTVTIFAQSSFNGTPTPAQSISLSLLLPGGTTSILSLSMISPGVYRATYNLPTTAIIGTYALVATARVNNINASSLTSFEVKPTWLQTNSRTVLTAGSIIGAVGTVSILGIVWKKGYFARRKDELPIP